MLGKKKFTVTVFLFMISNKSACGRYDDDKPGVIGEEVTPISPIIEVESAEVSGLNEQQLFYFDQPSSRIMKISVEQAKVEPFFNTPVSVDQGNHFVLPAKHGDYVVSLANKTFHVIDKQGRIQANPLNFQGTPVSTAYDRENEYIIIYDDFQSIGLVELSPEGLIEDSWLGGPVLSDDKTILAGDVDGKGQMILYFSDHSIGVVDIKGSLTKKKWVYSDFALGEDFGKVNWLAPIPNSDFVIVTGKTAFGVIDIKNKMIVSSRDLGSEGRTKSQSRRSEPHFVSFLYEKFSDGAVFKKRSVRLWTVDENGNLQDKSMPDSMLEVVSSDYDRRTNSITFGRYTDGSKAALQIIRMRASDALVTQELTFSTKAMLAVNSDYAVSVFPSSLGYIEITKIIDKSQQQLRSFNIPYYRE